MVSEGSTKTTGRPCEIGQANLFSVIQDLPAILAVQQSCVSDAGPEPLMVIVVDSGPLGNRTW